MRNTLTNVQVSKPISLANPQLFNYFCFVSFFLFQEGEGEKEVPFAEKVLELYKLSRKELVSRSKTAGLRIEQNISV